jgi:hypothetical protein
MSVKLSARSSKTTHLTTRTKLFTCNPIKETILKSKSRAEDLHKNPHKTLRDMKVQTTNKSTKLLLTITSGERMRCKSNSLWLILMLRECWNRSRKIITWQKKLDQIGRERQCKNSSITKRHTTNQQIPDHLNNSQSKVRLETSEGVIESDQMLTRKDTLSEEAKETHSKSSQMETLT